MYVFSCCCYVASHRTPPVGCCRLLQGRALSRAKSRRNLDYSDVLSSLEAKGISIRVASPKLVMEEAPESYKNVTDVVNTCTSLVSRGRLVVFHNRTTRN